MKKSFFYFLFILSFLLNGCKSGFIYNPYKGKIFENNSRIINFECNDENLKLSITKHLIDNHFVISQDTNVKIRLIKGNYTYYIYNASCVDGSTRRMQQFTDGSYIMVVYFDEKAPINCPYYVLQSFHILIDVNGVNIVDWGGKILMKNLSTMKPLPIIWNENDFPEYLNALSMFAFQDFNLLKTGTFWEKNLMLKWISKFKITDALPIVKDLMNSTSENLIKENCKSTISKLEENK